MKISSIFKRILNAILTLLLILLLLTGVYFFSAIVLSLVGTKPEEPKIKEVSIYILTNGVHTDIVVPFKNSQFDWSTELNLTKSNINFIGFGWGNKEFYLETPTWADLKFKTAFKSVFGLGKSAVHATFYNYMIESKECVKISLSQEQYIRLVKFIRNSFVNNKKLSEDIIKNAGYGDSDAFFDAKGSYNLFYTCNTWANCGLKACGQKACLWTPFDKGIFYHYRK